MSGQTGKTGLKLRRAPIRSSPILHLVHGSSFYLTPGLLSFLIGLLFWALLILDSISLELELIQTNLIQKPMLRVEVGARRFAQQTSTAKT